jgi:hypothetical protein
MDESESLLSFQYKEDSEMKKGWWIVVLVTFSFMLCACGGNKQAQEPAPAAEKQAAAVPVTNGEGVMLAREILGVFDEIVARVVELTLEKPAAAVLKPQLESLFLEYKTRMDACNAKYLGLKPDVRQWGACNRYLGENRGKHVYRKDAVLTEAVSHYNLQAGDPEIVQLITKIPVDLLNIAVKQTAE